MIWNKKTLVSICIFFPGHEITLNAKLKQVDSPYLSSTCFPFFRQTGCFI